MGCGGFGWVFLGLDWSCVIGFLGRGNLLLFRLLESIGDYLPLTRPVTFKTSLQCRNRFQVPRLLRWEYKLESTQTLEVSVKFEQTWSSRETFCANMGKDGRIAIPKLIYRLLKNTCGSDPTDIVDVELMPFGWTENEDT